MPTASPGRSARSTPARLLAGLAAGAVLGLGCAKQAGRDAATLEPADFRGPASESSADAAQAQGNTAPADPATAAAPANPTAGITPAARRQIRLIASSEASEGVLDVSVVPGPPRETGGTPGVASGAITLDSKVGEINGQPIIASKFLEPLDGRLRAIAKEQAGNPAAWRRAARELITRSLWQQVRDELLLAEAYASLSPEVREVGLRSVLTDIRENLVRQNEGSRELADQRLQEREGLSIEEKTKQALEKELVEHELRQRIRSRIHVSTRDQREYYDLNYAEFNPPGTAKLRVILVPKGDEAAVAKVYAALAASTPFAEAARLPENIFNRDRAGEHSVTITDAYDESQFFAAEEMNNAARALEPGGTIGPISAGNNVAWLHLESIERPPGVSFYEAQLQIEKRLLDAQSAAEHQRYFERLFSEGSYSNLDHTVDRLFTIATERYFGIPAQ